MDGRTDGHDEANNLSSQFRERDLKTFLLLPQAKPCLSAKSCVCWPSFLGAFATLPKVTIISIIFVRPSIRPSAWNKSASTREFSRILISEYLLKLQRENETFFKI